MKLSVYAAGLLVGSLLTACAATKKTAGTNARPALTGSTNLPQSYYDQARRTVPAYVLLEVSTDAGCAYTQKQPVCVRGPYAWAA